MPIEGLFGVSNHDCLVLRPEEPRSGYDRALFRLWIDADHDGCDTRREVLIAESLSPVRTGERCSLSGGRWYSAYDGVTTTDPSTFHIDHLVPLAEAWDSGASTWSSDRRMEYANDLVFSGSLIAVTASSNRSKSDSDPAEWEPPMASDYCTYATDWVEVKVRWSLAADRAEISSLRGMLKACGTQQTTPRHPIATVPPAPPSATVDPQPHGGNCAPSYPDFCIPPPPPDFDCSDVARKGFTVRWDVADPDPHRFDGDKDGVARES